MERDIMNEGMLSDDGRIISTIEKHGDWVKDDVDKILNEILTGDKEYTITVIKKIVLENLVKKVSEGMTLNEKLEKLVRDGIIESRDKETTIKLFSRKIN